MLGGQVVAEVGASGTWSRGYVYLGSRLLATQQGGVFFVHEDPVNRRRNNHLIRKANSSREPCLCRGCYLLD